MSKAPLTEQEGTLKPRRDGISNLLDTQDQGQISCSAGLAAVGGGRHTHLCAAGGGHFYEAIAQHRPKRISAVTLWATSPPCRDLPYKYTKSVGKGVSTDFPRQHCLSQWKIKGVDVRCFGKRHYFQPWSILQP